MTEAPAQGAPLGDAGEPPKAAVSEARVSLLIQVTDDGTTEQPASGSAAEG
jgi:hypothetical protein